MFWMSYPLEFSDGNDERGVGEKSCSIGWIDCIWSLKFKGSVYCSFRDMDGILDCEMRVLVD